LIEFNSAIEPRVSTFFVDQSRVQSAVTVHADSHRVRDACKPSATWCSLQNCVLCYIGSLEMVGRS